MSPTSTLDTRLSIRALVLDELPSLRLDRKDLEGALDNNVEARIPSRKALVIIARVCKKVGVNTSVVKKADLKPDQVCSLENLIELLALRIGPASTH